MPFLQNVQRQVQNASWQTFCTDPKGLLPPSNDDKRLDAHVVVCTMSSPGTFVRLLQNQRFQNFLSACSASSCPPTSSLLTT